MGHTNKNIAVRCATFSHSGKVVGWPTLVGLILTSLALSGCAGLGRWARNGKVGPEYYRPLAPVADSWIDADDPRIHSEAADYSHWWACFNDPVLDHLVYTAYQQNLTLQEAGMRILEARAQAAIARGNLFPQTQEATGNFSHAQSSQNLVGGPVLASNTLDTWDVGFNASWELDFWGRFRRNIEAADATWNASIEAYDDVLVILQAEVATAYIQMRTLQERLALALENIQAQERTLALTDARAVDGLTSNVDVAQAQENLALTKSLVPALRSGIRQSQNTLCILLGEPPHDLTQQVGQGPIPPVPAEVAIGIPADLLRRRPDVRQAERLAAAQSARIGIAESDFYPRIAINGAIGWASSDFSDLLAQGSFLGNINPGFTWNILNYGRLQNNVRAQQATFHQLVLAYQSTVLRANLEAENALVRFQQEHERIKHFADAVAASRRYNELVRLQYEAGQVQSLALVDSERLLRDRQDNWAESRGAVAIHLVNLYRALGGGWEMRYALCAAETPQLQDPIEGTDAQPVPPPVSPNASHASLYD